MTDHAAALGLRLHMLGFCNQSQMPVAYAAADVLVLPSDGRESWGLVANEALACGTPALVADNVGCAPDLARLLGEQVVFAGGNVDSLVDRLSAVLHCPPTRDAIAAANRAFSLSAAVSGIVAAMASLTVPAGDVDDRG